MKHWIAIDWGSTSLRAALVDAQGKVIYERSSERGILSVEAGGFAHVLQAETAAWAPTEPAFCLMSGMVGSRQGWVEAAYCPCPAGLAELAGRLTWVEAGRIAIVPGLFDGHTGVPDVMRGEETQVFGAMELLGIDSGMFVLPGTHSKWVRVKEGRIQSFTTFMTGEFYALLRKHSILARTMPQADGDLDEMAFRRGVGYARECANLLHSAFSARTLSLFDRMTPGSLPSYLSGIVIGEELRAQELQTSPQPVVIIGSEALTRRYEIALEACGAVSTRVGAQATWRGLWSIARHLENAHG